MSGRGGSGWGGSGSRSYNGGGGSSRGRGRGGRGRGHRGRGRNSGAGGRGRNQQQQGGGGRGGRGGGGYDWTKHLPPDHPMRRGLGPDPSRRRRNDGGISGGDNHQAAAAAAAAGEGWDTTTTRSSNDWQQDNNDSYIAAEYAAYYERQSARTQQRSESDRQEFERVSALLANNKEESNRRRQQQQEEQETNSNDDNAGATTLAARQAVLAMSEEEREAALARHEERQAMSKYAFDLNPEALNLSDKIRTELEKAVTNLDKARNRVDAVTATKDERSNKKTRKSSSNSGVVGQQEDSVSYFNTNKQGGCDNNNAEEYKSIVANRIQSPAYQRMLCQRTKLPAYQMAAKIADTLLSPNVSTAVVSGETGCGKTTQCPRIIVEEAAKRGMGRLNILVAQPRRIAAIGVAERVAEEGGTGAVPGEPNADVGYHIRHDRKVGKDANIVFATTGIVLRILAGDPLLRGVDMVIVDECHERSSDGDFLVTVLRDLATSEQRGPGSDRPLKLVLMSATVDSDFFVNYLGQVPQSRGSSTTSSNSNSNTCDIPVLHIEGVAHPVQDLYLEDAINACSDQLHSADDMFELRQGKGWNNNNRRNKANNKYDGRKRGVDQEEEEEQVRARREEYIRKQFGNSKTAELVSAFDIKAKISEKESHLKSTSSGELPIGLAYHLIFHLDRIKRPIDNGDGAILVFLSGAADIDKLHDALKAAAQGEQPTTEASNLHILSLHGSMPTSEQRRVFQKPPGNKRKVVLSTNVAESSITIDDVVYCLDLGKHKEKTYDPTSHIECLLPTWISKASARQRRGRAGRVRPGECWHLFPSFYVLGCDLATKRHCVPGGDEDPTPAFNGDVKFRAFALPEMLRTPLEDVCLRARYLGLAPPGTNGVERFLMKCPSSPGPLSLHNAMEALGPSDMNLLSGSDEELTPMGRAVASIPVPPRFGLALMLADHLDCEEDMLTLCALLSGRTPFYAPMTMKAEADKAKRAFAEDIPSDLYAAVRAYEEWEKSEDEGNGWAFCRSNFVSRQAMLTAKANRRQLSRDLKASKLEIFARGLQTMNKKAQQGRSITEDQGRLWHQWGRVMGVLAASFGSQLARLDHGGSGKCRCPIFTKQHGRIKLFPSSISSPEGAARDVANRQTTYYVHRWGIYMEKVRNAGGICLYDVSEVFPLAVSVCVSGERTYDRQEDSNRLIVVNSGDGKVTWSDNEVKAMTARRELLCSLVDSKDSTDAERVGARVEIEDIETRLGIVELIGKSDGKSRSDSDDIDMRVLNFVVSALESNGGTYPMAALRRMMKADMDLYTAMGPVHSFAAQHSSILTLEKIGGKWMFVLKPGAKGKLQDQASGKGHGSGSRFFYGPKQWVYYNMEDHERECVARVRKSFREIIDARVSGSDLLPEEEQFLKVLGWSLEEEFTTSN